MSKPILTLLILGAMLLLTFAPVIPVGTPARAQEVPPPLPHAFFGSVQVNGQPAPVGTRVEARGPGILTGIEGNPVVVATTGRYGGPTISEQKLVVQGEIQDDAPIAFYVNGARAEVAAPGGGWTKTYPFVQGVVTELNLRATFSVGVYLPMTVR